MTTKWTKTIMLSNPGRYTRTSEPVFVDLDLSDNPANEENLFLHDVLNRDIPFQLFDIKRTDNKIVTAKMVFLVDMLTDVEKVFLSCRKTKNINYYKGIQQLSVQLDDGVRRIDTGCFELEMCRGTGNGTSASKWGIRYFKNKDEGKNLIKDCSNAIGGFYGPFFTPSNGLINPPEHVIADFEAQIEGPLYCRYCLSGTIPNGLDSRLHDKKFRIIWEFFYNCNWFRRQYFVDHFETETDGIPVINKITVGDEFESGKGNTVFSRFAAYGDTRFRKGDPYADILATLVKELLLSNKLEDTKKLREYKKSIGEDINKVSWDYFWRLFCVKEGILDNEDIRKHVAEIVPLAHRSVHCSERYTTVHSNRQGVNVNECPQQTIFPIGANKTAEINEETGYTMIWYTSNPVARYQIVQRKDSGWVNWGTNGENEYPELPVGSTIITAYGKFDDWERQADALEFPIIAYQSKVM